MTGIIEFVSLHYAWFLTITIILVFALIGYIVDSRREKSDLIRKNEYEVDEESISNLVIPEGKTLNDSVVNSKAINPETKQVELTDTSILGEENTNNQN